MSVAFAYPYDLDVHTDRASHLRPGHMYSAMGTVLGGELITCMGKNRFKGIQDKSISALYMESINRPFKLQKLLEGKIDLYSDYRYLRSLKNRGAKLAIYYRDGFWAGDLYKKQMPFLAPEFVRNLYRQDWEYFKEVFDEIYLPSNELAKYMGESNLDRYKELLPGCSINTESLKKRQVNTPEKNILKLVYVGGIAPPLNDLSLALEVFGNRPGIEIIMLLRKGEVDKYHGLYNNFDYSNVRLILDESGKELIKYYDECDASLLVYPDHDYRAVAMPYKAFEAFGHGLPVIASTGTVFSRLVNRYDIGLIADNNELLAMADDPVNTRKSLYELSENVRKYAVNNTWETRALQVIKDIK